LTAFASPKKRALETRSESAYLFSTFLGNWFELFTNQASGFIHKWMLEGAGVGIKRGCFEAQFRPVLRQPETAVKTSRRIFFDPAALRPKRPAAASATAMVGST
jgi:hypothetical protein